MKPEEIEENIEQTRLDMTETIQAIERKLSPRQLMDYAMDTVRSSETQAWVVSTVKQNPVPLALIGLGLGWLVVSQMSRKSGGDIYDYDDYSAYDEAGAVEGGYASAFADSYVATDTPTAPIGDYGSEGTGYGAAETAADPHGLAYGGDGGSRSSGRTAAMRQKASDYSRRARYEARRYAGQTSQIYTQHPLTMGVMAMAVGAAIGALLPRTRQENEMLGEQSQEVMRQLREKGVEAMERARNVADRTAKAAGEEARSAMHDQTQDLQQPSGGQQTTGSTDVGAGSRPH